MWSRSTASESCMYNQAMANGKGRPNETAFVVWDVLDSNQ